MALHPADAKDVRLEIGNFRNILKISVVQETLEGALAHGRNIT
jgi:hypothetical protein